MVKTYFQPTNNELHSEWLKDILEPLSVDKDYKEADVLLLSGGADINPKLYEESTGEYTYIDEKRDLFEMNIYNEYKDKPKIGICRGGQLLTVLNGGKLIQDVTGHNKNHYIKCFNLDYPIMCTSSHHQLMWPWTSNNMFYVLASSEGISSHYLNGNNQNAFKVILSSRFLSVKEPEIIYWPETKSLCIQGHPEWTKPKDNYREYCKYLITFLIEDKLDSYIINSIISQ